MAPSNTFITVYSFASPHELAIVVGRLESEGVECFVQDELTIQANPFYSNALGGIKLQVQEHDLEKTIDILKEAGYISGEDEEPSKLLTWLDKQTCQIPFLSKLQLEYRIMILVPFIIALSAYFVFYLTKTSNIDRLLDNKWCVDYVIYDNQTYIPSTDHGSIRVSLYGHCNETISFKYTKVLLPGFDSKVATATWNLRDEHLQIANADTFSFIYNGIYNIKFTKAGLILKSDKTTLLCSPENE